MIYIDVIYTIKAHRRTAFIDKVLYYGIEEASRNEEGNVSYAMSSAIDDENKVLIHEIWKDEEARSAHGNTKHYERLTALKKDYVENVEIKVYRVEELS